MQCQSGDGLTENGEGLCLRDATKRVRITRRVRTEKVSVEKVMCRFCAGSWSASHPTTIQILGDLEPAEV